MDILPSCYKRVSLKGGIMIIIFQLKKRVANDLKCLYENRIFRAEDDNGDTVDVVLNPHTIMKSVDDLIAFDLGGVNSSIELNDFHYISIS